MSLQHALLKHEKIRKDDETLDNYILRLNSIHKKEEEQIKADKRETRTRRKGKITNYRWKENKK